MKKEESTYHKPRILNSSITLSKSVEGRFYNCDFMIFDLKDVNLLLKNEREFVKLYELKENEKFVIMIVKKYNPNFSEYDFFGIGVVDNTLKEIVNCQFSHIFKSGFQVIISNVKSPPKTGIINSKAGLPRDYDVGQFDGYKILNNECTNECFITYYKSPDGDIYMKKRYFLLNYEKGMYYKVLNNGVIELVNETDMEPMTVEEINSSILSVYEVKGKGRPVYLTAKSGGRNVN